MTGPRDLEQLVLDTWDFGDPAASAARFADAAAVLRTQQARAVGLAGDFEEAGRILDGIEATSDHARARVAIERGRVLNSTGDPAGAAAWFDQAHRLATAAGAGGLALDARHMQAIVAG